MHLCIFLLCAGLRKKRPPGRFDFAKEAVESPPSPQCVAENIFIFLNIVYFLHRLVKRMIANP